jgi:hypothetical protein
MKGFDPIWCDWIKKFVQGGSVGIRVNEDIDHYFQTKKGLHQGDPLSPMFFNLVADMLAILISRAKENGHVGSLIPDLVEGGSQFYNILMIRSYLWNMIFKKQ